MPIHSRLATTTLLAALVLLAPAAPAVAAPVTRVVDDDGHASPTSCASDRKAPRRIQVAIDRSGPGDTILVCPGAYAEQLVISGSSKNRITLRSIRPGGAIVRRPAPHAATAGVTPAEGTVLIEVVGAHGVRIAGFRVVSQTTAPCRIVHDAIRVGPDGDGATVTGNRVMPGGSDTFGDLNDCGFQTGIAVYASPDVTVSGNLVKDFRLYGVFAQDGVTSAVISGNTLSFHHADASGPGSGCPAGVSLEADVVGTVLDNDIVGLSTAGSTTPVLCTGIYAEGAGSDLAIKRNLVRYADYGMELGYGISARVVANELRNNRQFGLYLYNADFMRVRHNLIRGFAHQGIWVSDLTSDAVFDGNDVAGAGSPDCQDLSTGGLPGAPTYGTANTWTDNTGADGDPVGICAP